MKILLWNIEYLGFSKVELKILAQGGRQNLIAAIKSYRDSFLTNKRPGLKESKDKIEDYMWKIKSYRPEL